VTSRDKMLAASHFSCCSNKLNFHIIIFLSYYLLLTHKYKEEESDFIVKNNVFLKKIYKKKQDDNHPALFQRRINVYFISPILYSRLRYFLFLFQGNKFRL
jgi:hypothetical protein